MNYKKNSYFVYKKIVLLSIIYVFGGGCTQETTKSISWKMCIDPVETKSKSVFF